LNLRSLHAVGVQWFSQSRLFDLLNEFDVSDLKAPVVERFGGAVDAHGGSGRLPRVGIQFDSMPGGAVGPKYSVTEPSAFCFIELMS